MPVALRLPIAILGAFVTGAFALSVSTVPARAFPDGAAGAISPSPILHAAARKGTRNYVPGAATTPLPDAATAASRQKSEDKAVADCVAIWDAGTHITKRKWKEICKRQVKDRTELGSP